jgi:hypothetical protein
MLQELNAIANLRNFDPELTSFLTVPTTQADRERYHRIRNIILIWDESSLVGSLQSREMKRKTPANFSFLQFHCKSTKFRPNKVVAFWTFQQLKPIEKETIVSYIDCSANPWNEKRPPIFVSYNSIANLWNFNSELTSFLNVPTTQANIEGHHHIRNRILM